MPALGGGGYYDLTPRSFNATDQDLNQAAGRQFGITNFNPLEEVGYGILGGVSDTIDTISSSLGFVTGTERGEVNSFVQRTLGMPGFNRFMTDQRESVEAISGVANIILSAVGTGKLTAPASFLMKGLRTTPYLRRIAVLDDQYEAAMQTVLATRTAIASRGATGAAQMRQQALVDAMVFDAKSGAMVQTQLTRSAAGASTRAAGLGALRGVRDAAVGEALLGVIANQNGFLYDDDMAYNLAWGGAGLLAGGAIESVMTRYRLRKLARTDVIDRAMSDALDPGGYQESRLSSFSRGLTRGERADETLDFFGGGFTDSATQLGIEIQALKAAPLSSTDNAAALQSNRMAEITAKTQQQRDEVQKVTIKGFDTDGRTAFSMDKTPQGRHVDLWLNKDAMAVNQVEMIGAVTPDLPGSETLARFTTRVERDIAVVSERIAKLREAAEQKPLNKKGRKVLDNSIRRLKRLEKMRNFDLHGVIDGELVSPSMLATYERYTDPRIITERLDAEKSFWRVADDAMHGKGILVGDNLEVVLPDGKTFDNLDYFDMLALYKTADSVMDTLKRRTNYTINLPENPTWFQLDMAEELMKRAEGKTTVIYPPGMTREKAQIESLIQKAQALRQIERNPVSSAAEEMHKARIRLNLPRLTSYEAGVLMRDEHELEFLLRGIANQDPNVVRGMSLEQIREGLQQARTIENGVPVIQRDVDSIVGTSFRFMRDDFGNAMEPLVVATRPNTAIDWTPDSVAERLASRKQLAYTKLTDTDADELTRELAAGIAQLPDFHLASRPDQLMEAEIQGSILGSTPQSFMGALTKELKPSDWNHRESPVLLAAGRLRDYTSRIVRARFAKMAENAFGESLKLLKNPRNAASVLLLDTFHSFRGGWDLKAKPLSRPGQGGKNFHAFVLEPTAENQNRWRRLYGEEMPEGATLRGFDGKEIVLDDLGLQLQMSFNRLTAQVIKMQNTILRANGLGQIREQLWYVAPQEIQGKYAGWIMGPDRKAVAAVTADTQEEFARKQQLEMERIAEMTNGGAGYVFLTRDQITDFASIWDLAHMEMMSPGTSAFLPGKTNRGNLGSAVTRINAFQGSLQAMQDRIMRHGGEVLETMMREQIKASKARAQAARLTNPDMAKNRFAPTGFRTVHDYYLEALLGRSKSSHTGSITGGISRHLEGISDQAIEAVASPVARTWAALTERLARTDVGLWDTSEKARKDYDALVSQLGNYMPFKSSLELAEARGLGRTPLNTAKIVGGVNRMTAALTLRFLEMAHPVLNLAGMVNASPAIIRSMTPMQGETRDQFAARIGHSAMIFDLPDGRSFGVPDMTKIFGRAVRRAWSRASEPDYQYMLERGFIQQEVAEFNRQFAALQPQGPIEEKMSRVVELGSIASDRSEDFSRSIGHFIGLELADRLGIAGRDARHMFAHDVANKMIANYDPHNRAEVFQGAFGSALGLFQSFAHNYYGRLFRYVETGDLRSFLTQNGVQASLFGFTGLTGWEQASNFVEWISDGERRPNQDIYGTAGTGLIGDIVSNGLISQVPRIFSGGQLPAIDMYTRGDTNVRFPGMANGSLSMQAVPGFSAITRVAGGLIEGISAFAQEGTDLSLSRIAEIASNMVVNRPIAGMIEVALNDGNSVDSRGQLVNETRDAMEATYRMLGMRSRRQTLEREAYYSDKRTQEIQRSKREKLNKLTRNAIRNNDMDKLPRIYEDYILTGGRPEYFRQWLKGAYEAATSTVAQRRLDELLRDPAKFGDAMRFMDMQVGIEEDEVAGQQEVNDSLEPTIDPGEF